MCVCVCVCVLQLSQAQTGKFNVHVHVEYEWRLQNQDLDESDDEMEDKVSLGGPWLQGLLQPSVSLIAPHLKRDPPDIKIIASFVTAAYQGAENGPQRRQEILEQKCNFILSRGRRQQAPTSTGKAAVGGKQRSLARHCRTKVQGNRKLAVATTGKISNMKSKKKGGNGKGKAGSWAELGLGVEQCSVAYRGLAVALTWLWHSVKLCGVAAAS